MIHKKLISEFSFIIGVKCTKSTLALYLWSQRKKTTDDRGKIHFVNVYKKVA